MPVLIRTEGLVANISTQQVATCGEHLLAAYGMEKVELSILLVDDKRMAELNHAYRQKKGTTNVLSFPISEEMNFSGPEQLGDIVISVDTARKEAGQKGVSAHQRIERLLIHGFVHLLGYDHERSTKKTRSSRT
jgi:rRNA maturation RNase YbeY